ncbi:28782db7-0c2e-42ca-bae9-0e17e58f203c [Sclerotinia trifoliorum]|uniref:28782db7-0c2e-42ca-bae9-0e17e58f203c n=1 Tax=Sclerotinia trifoliorum TaxID=28548 RepID=A0A8H2ZSR6_9HELO|nr:28782db7-0c2e-42ca-bae9-0e17e58f203c [Sclerotinia trifoliorum]
MPAGFPAFPASRFPNEKPPTSFHPSSPRSQKVTPVSYSTSRSYTVKSSSPKASMDTSSTYPANDTSSLYSTASTISLLKHPVGTLKAKLSRKEHSKGGEVNSYKKSPTASSMRRNSSEKSPRQSLTETYLIMAMR